MITFRTWQREDLPWLAQAATVASWEGLTPAEQAEVDPNFLQESAVEQLRDVLGGPTGNAVIAETDGRPVGFALGALAPDTSTGEPNGLILSLWVDPARRRQGVAKGLLQVTEALFGCCDVRKVKLWTPLSNEAVVRLGETTGYVREGVINRKQFA
ncbi:MAG TPA: GNAT family N-acetyltransferase [Symbiobacteriaceae bacterium]|nr:GNAT family N-acetyltransferase [Symbiobacteriaceae bacterium]